MPDSSTGSRWYFPRVVGTSALVLALTAPGQTAAISAFVDPLIEGLHLSRSVVSTAYMAGTLVGAGVMPLLGRAIDRYGPRLLMVGIALGFGAVLMGLSAVQGLVGLTAGFVGIRMLGQGALNLAATTAVALYVSRRRGLAQGITAAVGAAGISLAPVLLENVVATHGFRTVWFVEGLVIWAAVIPLALLGLPKRRPRLDLLPRDDSGSHHASKLPPVDWTLREALRTPMFWVVASGVTMVSTLGTAAAFHQIALLGERGLSRAEAAANFLPQTAAGLATTLLIGYLADRISDRLLIIASLALLAGALTAGGYVTPGLPAIGYGVAMGVAGNSFRTIEATAFPNTFGLAHIGAIRGVVHTLGVAGSALGPLMLSLGHEWFGSYRPALLVLAVLPVGTIVFALLAKTPPPYPPGRAAEH